MQRLLDRLKRARRRAIARVVVAMVLAACSSPAKVPAPLPAPVTLADAVVTENVDLYRGGGFVVGSGAVPFVGIVRFAATEFLDSTAVVVALSVPPRSLSFVRAGDRYAAFYSMRIDLLRGDAIVRSERPTGEVRVASFAETTRGDEGVLFQRTLRLAPGSYDLRLTAQDSLGTGSGSATTTITVPSLGEATVGSLIPVFLAETRKTRSAPLTIVVNPRATVRYGRDSVLELYVESYGASTPDTILVTATREDASSSPLITDTLIASQGAVRGARATLPVFRLGLGALRIAASLADGRQLDTIRAVVSLGLDIPVDSVPELIEALRYFASESDLQRLRMASGASRPRQWAAFVRRTDPNPATPDNEALLEYARRLRVADRLYRVGARHGWQTDRGAVISALGEPDVMGSPQPGDTLGETRTVTWEYRRHRTFLVFSDAAGPGDWRLTPVSADDFRALLALAGPCVGCR